MKGLFSFILSFTISILMAKDAPHVEGFWTCSKKDCKIEIYKAGNTYEAKLLWAKKELDENGKLKLDKKNPDPTKRNLPVIGGKTLWNAQYNPQTGYFENATAYRNGKHFCGKFILNADDTLSVTGYNCSLNFLRYTEIWTKIE